MFNYVCHWLMVIQTTGLAEGYNGLRTLPLDICACVRSL
jgi:hypothetical protein